MIFNLKQLVQNATDVQTFLNKKERDGVDQEIYDNGLMFCGGDLDCFSQLLMMNNPMFSQPDVIQTVITSNNTFSQSSIGIIMGDDEEKKELLSKQLFEAAKLTL